MTLIAHWPLQEEGTSTAYDVRGSNDGTLNGGVTQGATGLLGTSAYSFDGTDDYVDIPAGIFSTGSDWSVSIWFNMDSTSTEYRVFDLRGDIFVDTIGLNNSGNGYLEFFDGSWHTVKTNMSTNMWYHYVLTYDDSAPQFTAYVNGVQEATSGNSTSSRSETTVIGAAGWDVSSRNFGGKVADARAYNRALTASEIQYLYDVVASPSKLVTSAKTP